MTLPGFYGFVYHGVPRVALLIRRDGLTGNLSAWEIQRGRETADTGYKTYAAARIESPEPRSPERYLPEVPQHVLDHYTREGVDFSALTVADEPDLDDILYGAPETPPEPATPPPADPWTTKPALIPDRHALWVSGSVAYQPWAISVEEEFGALPTVPPPALRFYVVSYNGLSLNWLLGPYATADDAAANVRKGEHFRSKSPELDPGPIGVAGFAETVTPVARYGQ